MELPGCLDVPERFVETTCDVVVAVNVEARAREPARAGLRLERMHDRAAPALSALVLVHRDVVDPRHRRVIGRRTEPQHADPLASLLAEGVETPGHALLTAEDPSDGERVGVLWFGPSTDD